MPACKSWLRVPLLLALSHFIFVIDHITADTPIIQTIYTADLAPVVHNIRLYIFTSHGENTANNGYDMKDWRLFSTSDMVN